MTKFVEKNPECKVFSIKIKDENYGEYFKLDFVDGIVPVCIGPLLVYAGRYRTMSFNDM